MAGGGNQNRTRRIALSGILAALSVIILLGGAVIPIGTFAAPIFAGLCLIPIAMEYSGKAALLAYLAVGLLSLFLVPDKEVALFFLLLTGYYPVLYPALCRLHPKGLQYVVKLLIFNAAVAAVYALLLLLFTSAPLRAELAARPAWFWGILLVAANCTFVLYDILIGKLRILYQHKWRGKLFR